MILRVRYRSSENNYTNGHIYICMIVLETANKCIYKDFLQYVVVLLSFIDIIS